MKKALVVIALKGFQDHELAGVLHGLHSAAFNVTLCGKEAPCLCVGKFGGTEQTKIALRDVKPSEFDRICFIGGPGASDLIEDKEAHALAKSFYDQGKVVGAICIAPMILAAAGLLKGKRATVWDSKEGHGPQVHFLQEQGALVDQKLPVVVDFPLVTGNGPNAASEFGRVFAMV